VKKGSAAKRNSRVSRNSGSRPSADELVREIHQRHAAGEPARARRLVDALLRVLEPQLRRQARGYEKVSGSLLEDDLVQVALLEALKALETYKPEKRGRQTFTSWVEWRARRAILEAIRLHCADVRPSDAAQRGRKGKPKTRVAQLVSRDDAAESLPGSLTQMHDAALALEVATVEELYAVREECARLRFAVLRLDPKLRELVTRVHGLGQEACGIRQVAEDWNEPRSRLDVMLVRAHELLRERLSNRGD
jgi:RNA polymerase sigma factor (sigma-70 family)